MNVSLILFVLVQVWVAGFIGTLLAGEVTVLPPHVLTHEQEMRLTLHAPNVAGERIRFSFEFEKLPLAEGTVGIDQNGTAQLAFQAPLPKQGLSTKLTLRLSDPNTGKEIRTTSLWIFPEDAWSTGKRWLEEWPLHLYDPSGNTAVWLDQQEIPFQRIHDLATPAKGAVVVGEGLSLPNHPDFLEPLRDLAASGIPVLVLLPSPGTIDLPVAQDGQGVTGMYFREEGKLRQLDSRFPGAGFTQQYFNLLAEQGRVRIQVNSEEGWPWLEFMDEKGTQIVFCGTPILSYEHESPAPLLLLEKLLYSLYESTKTHRKNP